MAKDVGLFIQSEFGVTFEQENMYRLLHQLSYSHGLLLALATRNNLRPHKRFFKNFRMATMLNTPGHVALDRIDAWFQYETRFCQQNTITRIWAKRGTRPRAIIRQQQFESAYLYGAVCPATGATQAIIAPHINREYVYEHLKLISSAKTFGRHALVIMDRAAGTVGSLHHS